LVKNCCWSKTFLVKKFLLLQNHFFGNILGDKFFLRKFFWSKFFLLQNHFLGNRLNKNYFWTIIFLVENCCWSKNVLVKNFLLLQNHFLGNSLDVKFFLRKVLVENFFCCKIISSETVWMKKFLLIIFYCCKIISSETVWMKKFFVENFLLLQNNFLGKSLDIKVFCQKFFVVAKSFPQKQTE